MHIIKVVFLYGIKEITTSLLCSHTTNQHGVKIFESIAGIGVISIVCFAFEYGYSQT
jgi:hypothetical protein